MKRSPDAVVPDSGWVSSERLHFFSSHMPKDVPSVLQSAATSSIATMCSEIIEMVIRRVAPSSNLEHDRVAAHLFTHWRTIGSCWRPIVALGEAAQLRSLIGCSKIYQAFIDPGYNWR